MAVDDDKIADFTVDNYAAVKLKHSQRATCSVPDPTDINCFSTSRLSCHSPTALVQCWMAFRLQNLKDLTAMSNGQTGLNFLRVLTNLVNVILNGKVLLELRPDLICDKINALKNPMEDFVLSL